MNVQKTENVYGKYGMTREVEVVSGQGHKNLKRTARRIMDM